MSSTLAAVEKYFTGEVVDGFSVSLDGRTPTRGYMVSLPGREVIVKGGNLLEAIRAYFVENVGFVGSSPHLYFGGWRDPGTGWFYLDVSANYMDYRRAAIEGAKAKQIAIWDVVHGRAINL